jgi:hypothetical protein
MTTVQPPNFLLSEASTRIAFTSRFEHHQDN